MDADEIKRQLAATDAMLKESLATLGATPEEIDRQLDPNVPEAVKKEERERFLMRKFVADASDPKSGVMDEIVERVVAEAEKQMPEFAAQIAAERAARRKRLVIGAAIGGALVAGLAVWFFVLRDTRLSCERLVGPLPELEQLTGQKLVLGHGYETKLQCRQEVDEAGRVGGYVVELNTESAMRPTLLDSRRKEEAQRAFAKQVTVQTATGEAYVFVAGDHAVPSDDALMADVQKRVGKSHDPMGDMLASLPPEQHVVILRGAGTVITLKLARKMFTEDQAKTVAIAVATRAK